MKLAIEENTVSSENQVKESDRVQLYPGKTGGKKICFLGNSITLHAPCPEIGWHGNWGMAASAPEKDYCHRIMTEVKKKDPSAGFLIVQGAEWERHFWAEPAEYPDALMQIPKFDPDIVVLRLAENVSKENCALHDFEAGYAALCDFLSGNGRRQLLLTDGFWYSPWTQDAIRKTAERFGGMLLLSDLGNQSEMKAVGLFKHSGVAAHPGDEGMKVIAERVCDRLLTLL